MKPTLIFLAAASLPLLLTSCYTTGLPYGGGGGGYGAGYGSGHGGSYHAPFGHVDTHSDHQPAHYGRRVYRSGHHDATPFTGHSDTHGAGHRTSRSYSDPHHGGSRHGHDAAGHRTDSHGHHVDKHGHEKDPDNAHD